MPASITPLLAERLDVSEERARSLLQTLLQELRRRAESDSVRLPELGTFREEDGRLTFVPSPSLRRRVNHRYEGLSAEDLTAPSSEPPSPAGIESVSEAESSHGGPDDEPIPTLDPIDEEDTSEQEGLPSAKPEPPPRGASVDSFSVISLVLAFLFLLGAAWFVLDRTNVWSPFSSPQPPVAAEQVPETSDTTDAQQTNRSSGVNAAEQDEPDTTTQDTTAQPTRNWAIVVASRSSRAAAEETAKTYRSRFDSVEVVSGTVNGRTWYRVAIGGYASEAAAERALDENAASLPSGAWSHRLR
jgi:septal ring-binding cell division protein DamX